MVKTQESNRDYKEGDPTQIHWAKFSMMGRFVSITSQCQNQCRSSSGYDLPERTHIRDLFHKRTVMSPDVRLVTSVVSFYNLIFSNSCKECASRIRMSQMLMLSPPVNFSFGDIHTLTHFGTPFRVLTFVPSFSSYMQCSLEILVNAHSLYDEEFVATTNHACSRFSIQYSIM